MKKTKIIESSLFDKIEEAYQYGAATSCGWAESRINEIKDILLNETIIEISEKNQKTIINNLAELTIWKASRHYPSILFGLENETLNIPEPQIIRDPEITEITPNTIIGEDYEGLINLSAWKGFESRDGPYGSKDSEKVSDGTVKAIIRGESIDYVHILSPAQFKSIKFHKEKSELVRDSILDGLLKDYPNTKEIYEDLMPEINSINDYKNHIGVAFLHIMDSEKDGYAYVGFELGCTWDEEHGIGVMMHKDRVVKIGLAEESFNNWNCYHDNGTAEYEQTKWKKASELIQKRRKKWWQLWK